MKSILYVAYMNLGKEGTIGILKKIQSQLSVFTRNDFQVYYIYVEKDILKSNFVNKSKIDFDINHIEKSINNALLQENMTSIDFAYIRFDAFSRKFMKLLQYLNTNNVKILLEIPTYPFIGEYKLKVREGIANKEWIVIRRYGKLLCTYSFFSKYIKKYVNKIITFSDDNRIWGVKTIQIANGVETNRFVNLNHVKKKENKLEMICVSSCLNWHGYDRVIEGMRQYYKNTPDIIVTLNIVGEGPETPVYKKMVLDYHLQNYVTFHGNLYGDKLDQVYSYSQVALDAMGRHRVGVFYNSSIKGKEYAFAGLPIVSGVRTEFDKDNSCAFYLRVPADDSPVSINNILKFVDKVEKDGDYHEKIHSYAVSHFSFDNTMKPVMDYIRSYNLDYD